MQKEKKLRTPMTPERIFTITMILTFAVGIFFMVKNFMGGAAQAAIIIGVCLVVFALVVFLLNKLRAPKSAQMMAVSVLLVILVLCWAVMRFAPTENVGLLSQPCLLDSFLGGLLGPLFLPITL